MLVHAQQRQLHDEADQLPRSFAATQRCTCSGRPTLVPVCSRRRHARTAAASATTHAILRHGAGLQLAKHTGWPPAWLAGSRAAVSCAWHPNVPTAHDPTPTALHAPVCERAGGRVRGKQGLAARSRLHLLPGRNGALQRRAGVLDERRAQRRAGRQRRLRQGSSAAGRQVCRG